MRRLWCLIWHWHRNRDCYGNVCQTCGLIW